MRAIRSITLAALTIGLGGLSVCPGQDGHDHAGPHGGTLAKAGSRPFEVVFAKAGLKLYPLTPDMKPVDASRLTATATFYHPNSPNPWFQKPLRPAVVAPGQTPTSLDLALDLSTIPATGAKVAFEVAGLPDPAAPSASFTLPFALPAPTLVVAPATQADQAAINAQRVCAVTGKPLGSMGGPIKVSRGNRAVFLCCQGCVRTVQAAPDRYFGVAGTL